MPPLPGAVSLLNALQGKVRMGIITNGFTSLQQTRLERTGLRDHFDLLIISEQVGVAKPDARIFDYALAQAGNPPRSRVLMVGDTAGVGYSRRRERRTGDLLAQCASARAAGGSRAGLDGDLVKRTGAAPVNTDCLPR